MNIYKKKTFKVHNLNQLDFYNKKYSHEEINLFHPFEFLIWQGPLIASILSKKISKKNTYIVETSTHIGLSMILMDLKIKNLSLNFLMEKKIKDKLCELAKKKEINIHHSNKFKFF